MESAFIAFANSLLWVGEENTAQTEALTCVKEKLLAVMQNSWQNIFSIQRRNYLLRQDLFIFCVSYVEERPWWPIQSSRIMKEYFFTVTSPVRSHWPMGLLMGRMGTRDSSQWLHLFFQKRKNWTEKRMQPLENLILHFIHVGERPWWPIQCLNKGRKKRAKG